MELPFFIFIIILLFVYFILLGAFLEIMRYLDRCEWDRLGGPKLFIDFSIEKSWRVWKGIVLFEFVRLESCALRVLSVILAAINYVAMFAYFSFFVGVSFFGIRISDAMFLDVFWFLKL